MNNPAAITRAERHLASVEPVMSTAIRRFGPCSLTPWRNQPFNVLARSIISQQLSGKAAQTITGRVLKLTGARSLLKAENVLASAPDALRACGLSGAKTRYLLGLAAACQSGELDFARLRRLDDDEALADLVRLPGVGVWTAQMFLMFALARPDILATGDVGLQRGMQLAFGLASRPDPERMTAISANWQPWRSVASWYLWQISDEDNPGRKVTV